jgi:hypothetical protein
MIARCPVCGGRAYARGGPGANWIESHAPGSTASHVPLYRPGAVFCFAGGMSLEDAVAVACILRTEGDRLLKAAHP